MPDYLPGSINDRLQKRRFELGLVFVFCFVFLATCELGTFSDTLKKVSNNNFGTVMKPILRFLV